MPDRGIVPAAPYASTSVMRSTTPDRSVSVQPTSTGAAASACCPSAEAHAGSTGWSLSSALRRLRSCSCPMPRMLALGESSRQPLSGNSRPFGAGGRSRVPWASRLSHSVVRTPSTGWPDDAAGSIRGGAMSTTNPPPGAAGHVPDAAAYEAMERSPEFTELRRSYRGFSFP